MANSNQGKPSKPESKSEAVVRDELEQDLQRYAESDGADKDTVAALMERLKAAEDRVKQQQAQIDELEQQSERQNIHKGAKPFVGPDGGYEFTVGPVADKYKEALPLARIRAVDESEALRFYCLTTDYPKGSNKQVDPVAISLRVVCIGRERAASIARQQRIATVRRKVQNGLGLSGEEQAIFEENEAKILGFVTGEYQEE